MMYDDVKVNWRDIAVHDENNIKGFFGDYRFLSNMTPCHVWYEFVLYPSVENAYMAAKVIPKERHHFVFYTPKEAKLNWRKHTRVDPTAEEWDARKLGVMRQCLLQKFSTDIHNLHLRRRLLDTGCKYLEEINWWGDVFYGVNYKTGAGENNLGKLLMEIRETIKNEQIRYIPSGKT